MVDRPKKGFVCVHGVWMRATDAIFSGPMIRAQLGDRKTNTRRYAFNENGKPTKWLRMFERFEAAKARGETEYREAVWVRESCMTWEGPTTGASYRADHPTGPLPLPSGSGTWSVKVRPAIHCPRWASRLTLVVMDVRRQRLQEISEDDARAEGVYLHKSWGGAEWFRVDGLDIPAYASNRARDAFAFLWASLHGNESWHANPEVIALSFEVHRCNIDAMGTEHAPAPAAA